MWRAFERALGTALLLALAGCSSSSASDGDQRAPERKVVDFTLMREDLLDGRGMPAGSFTFTYSTALNLERAESVGQTGDYSTFEYDPTGAQVILEKHYGQGDVLDKAIEYSYTGGVLSEAVSYDGNGVMLSFETYVFESGRKTSSTLHVGDVVHDFTFTYDAEGRRRASVESVGGVESASSMWAYASDGSPSNISIESAGSMIGGRNLTTVASGSNYDYFAFWDL